jgi:riboflavin biosynthesis protein RibD
MNSNIDLMLLAVQAGEKARYLAPPNPWVGALVVNENGVVICEGHTQVPGEAHAEIDALRRAGDRAKGATLVVTLEPCCHVGRTGPCTEAIVKAGIAKVVVGTIDPDPRVNGQGIKLLRASGVDVEVGVEEQVVRAQLASYLWHRVTGRPYVVAKIASTLDGIVAMAPASGSPARRRVATRTCCAPRARRSSSAREPCAPTTPALPLVWTTSSLSRCGWSSAAPPTTRRFDPASKGPVTSDSSSMNCRTTT